MASLAAASDMLDRYDEHIIGALLSRTTDPVTYGEWSGNSRFTAAMATATGEVMSALAKASRYSRTDITSRLTDESKALVVDMVCRIAFYRLWQVKPWSDAHDTLRSELRQEYEQMMDALNNGHIILELEAAKDAGLPDAAEGTETVAATRSRYFRSEMGRGNLFPTKSSTSING